MLYCCLVRAFFLLENGCAAIKVPTLLGFCTENSSNFHQKRNAEKKNVQMTTFLAQGLLKIELIFLLSFGKFFFHVDKIGLET